ncbi:putative 2-(R)-hydroxypropyl-CoM dehydrogenase [Polychaeton citri CBS 116435]|uniref:2-(R)-hydroxypropyl-CoM dehydrogenase n=1 Tax=Polychaeton citri CBS 116435 TaxID=1314669 RepID=A0A9P4UL73_9PEZI|nr:putative 2-(R)-hydroxypropyl-CoM dehydrogenase [Polychaeton citri CBS 116435]
MPPPQGQWNPLEGPGDYTVTKTVHGDTYAAIDPTQHSLSGKAVFISGASKGIGRQIALSFAQAGASFIAIGARSSMEDVEKEVKSAAQAAGKEEPRILAIKLDVTDVQSVDDAVREIGNAFGRLDIVINNAGVLGGYKKIHESDPDEWWQTWNVNLRGPYLIARACLPLILKTEGGLKTFVTVSSVGAHLVGPGLSDYQPSKLAVLRFTEFLAAEYRDEGVIAFSIHPGNLLTDIVGGGEVFAPELKAVFTEQLALPADTIVYLTATKRDFLTGRYVNATWDMPELITREQEVVADDTLKVKLDIPTPI